MSRLVVLVLLSACLGLAMAAQAGAAVRSKAPGPVGGGGLPLCRDFPDPRWDTLGCTYDLPRCRDGWGQDPRRASGTCTDQIAYCRDNPFGGVDPRRATGDCGDDLPLCRDTAGFSGHDPDPRGAVGACTDDPAPCHDDFGFSGHEPDPRRDYGECPEPVPPPTTNPGPIRAITAT